MLLSQRKRPLKYPLFISFNANSTHLLLGTPRGLKVFALNSRQGRPRMIVDLEQSPLGHISRSAEQHIREEEVDDDGEDQGKAAGIIDSPGGIGCFDVLDSTNLMVLVAGGRNPKFDPCKVVLWDDSAKVVLVEIEFSSPVKSAFLRLDLLIVLLTTKIIIYKLEPARSVCKKLYELDMYWNEYSCFGLSSSNFEGGGCILAFPARNKGQLQIVDITGCPLIPFQMICSGHDSAISSIAISKSGLYVATCSIKGTLIRIWNSKSGTLRHELRRGSDEADIYSMAFDPSNTRLCVASDKGTLHIFNLLLDEDPKKTIVSTYLPKYFSSDWSFSYCPMPFLTRCIVKFLDMDDLYDQGGSTHQNTILVVCDNGSLYTIVFDPVKGGEAAIVNHQKFMS